MGTLMASKAHILFIDAYDSFSNNIIALLQTELAVEVVKIHIDTTIPSLPDFLRPFAAIVCGSGPGNPTDPAAVGLFRKIWSLHSCDMLPVLGICLGFQSLVATFGGSVKRLPQARHGVETCLITSSESIFTQLPRVNTVQYHSLYVSTGHELWWKTDFESLWRASEGCVDLRPLAWELPSDAAGNGRFWRNTEPLLMAARHTRKPFYGLQFHPESICSQSNARQVVINWWNESRKWIQQHKPSKFGIVGKDIHERSYADANGTLRPSHDDEVDQPVTSKPLKSEPSFPSSSRKVVAMQMGLGSLTVPLICEALHLESGEIVLLDSEQRLMPGLAESSIIGIIEPNTIRLKYSMANNKVIVQKGLAQSHVSLGAENRSFFTYAKDFMANCTIKDCSDRAFYGGLMGYLTYEACLETLGVRTGCCDDRPDIHFAFVERSIVIDHTKNLLHVQCLQQPEKIGIDEWVISTAALLSALSQEIRAAPVRGPKTINQVLPKVYYCPPTEQEYKRKIKECQEFIQAGDSYELCLSDQTQVRIPKQANHSLTPWARYLRLRQSNPAPFAGFVRLGPLTLLSTSPERFMCWSRFEQCQPMAENQHRDLVSVCQFRPIKGTVSKQSITVEGRVERVTKEEAARHLSDVKERAENLMIVDLIRHDLYKVVSPWDVEVKALMAVEEYETVYQLVSVIEGKLFKTSPCESRDSHSTSHRTGLTNNGIDVLAASLPPGSMTGAPKLRSCQLLQGVEKHQPRSVYSGVLGYMCVSGKGDFSVVIRSAFKWDNNTDQDDDEHWRIGAGGAVTGLSTEGGEWTEMLAKLKSTLGGFIGET